MKSGANTVDQNKIRDLAEKGMPSDEISYQLKIEEKVVKAFMPTPSIDNDKLIAIAEMYGEGNEIAEIAEDLNISVEEVNAAVENL